MRRWLAEAAFGFVALVAPWTGAATQTHADALQELRDAFRGNYGFPGATATVSFRAIPGLAVGYTLPENPFGMPPRTMDDSGALVWDPAMEWTGGGLVSTSRDLAAWGQAMFTAAAMNAPYLDRLDVRLVNSPVGDRRDWQRIRNWADSLAPRLAI